LDHGFFLARKVGCKREFFVRVRKGGLEREIFRAVKNGPVITLSWSVGFGTLRAELADVYPTATLTEISDHGLTAPAIDSYERATFLTPRVARQQRVHQDRERERE